MKLLKYFTAGFAMCAILFSACTTNFQLTANWKDITIVYGLLDVNDTAQYIKINKAFLNPNTSALVLAQNPDSVYYPNLTVYMIEYDVNGNPTSNFRIPLTKVDGNLEGFPKQSGTFANSPNWLYKTKYHLNANYSYQLFINKPNNQTITASTFLVNNVVVLQPYVNTAISMLPGARSVYKTSWNNSAHTAFYGLTIRFHYVEFPIGNPADSVAKYFDWPIFTNYTPGDTTVNLGNEYAIPNNGLYEQMVASIPVNSSVNRIARSLDFMFAGGAPDLYTYINVANAQSGITQGQIEPTYTNISNGAYGIFSSRTFTSVTNIPIRSTTVDSMACSSATHPLGFYNSLGRICQ